MSTQEQKSSSGKANEENRLDRDNPGPVSVSSEDYTHNADKSEELDPNMADMSDDSKQKSSSGKANEENRLDRDNPGPVSVSSEDYTHNADKSEELDPNMADMSDGSKE